MFSFLAILAIVSTVYAVCTMTLLFSKRVGL